MTKRPRVPRTKSWRSLFILPEIPDSAPSEVKNALAIRNAASTSGVCPDCGATPYLVTEPPDANGIRHHMVFEHEPECGVFRDDDVA